MEEIEAERVMLQQRLTDQQMQISSLQSNLQALRHKTTSSNTEEVFKEEIEALKTELKLKEVGRKELEQKHNVAQVGLVEGFIFKPLIGHLMLFYHYIGLVTLSQR